MTKDGLISVGCFVNVREIGFSKLTSVARNFPAGKLQTNFRAFNYLKFQLRTLCRKEPHTTDVLNSPSLKKDKEKSTENINP